MSASKLAVALVLLLAAAGASAQQPAPATRPAIEPLTPPAPPATDLAPLPPQPRQDEAAVRVMNEGVYVPPAPIPGTQPRSTQPEVKPDADFRKPTLVKYPDGWSLVNRMGRLIRTNDESTFLFDSDDTPMLLLPNRQLETMEDLSDMGRRPVKFRVSGLVTEYRGKNYLMLQMVLVERGRLDR